MKISVLRSGSSGNCTLVEHNCCRILIDAGMSQKKIKDVLEEVNLDISKIQGVIITHLHSDHCNYSTFQICRKNGIPLYIHNKNVPAIKSFLKKDIPENLSIINFSDQPFQIGSFTVEPFDVSHDAFVVTSGFTIRANTGEPCLTYAADMGFFPDTLISKFINSDTIVLESNHDIDMLWKNPYRPFIHKKRVSGDKGHLSNKQSAEALIKIAQSSNKRPQVILCHLSQDHNSPQLALDTVGSSLEQQNISLPLYVAKRNERTPFFEIGSDIPQDF